MLAYLIGRITYLGDTKMIFENQYQGLWINIHQNNDFTIDEKKVIKIYCYEYQSNNLKNFLNTDIYGFRYLIERELFSDLISINGVGPKTALNIIASGAKEVIHMISSNAIDDLSEIVGVSRKLALIIISNLGEKYINKEIIFLDQDQRKYDVGDVRFALKNLGYNENEIKYGINAAMSEISDKNNFKEVSDFISYAIKAIAKQDNNSASSSTEV